MNKLFKLGLLTFLLIGFACQNKIKEELVLPDEKEEELSNIRMPFSQKVYLLNNKLGKTALYEVVYDFQGLKGDAKLNHIADFNGHSHMTVAPDGKTLVIVNNGGNRNHGGRNIYFYNLENGTTITATLSKSNKKGGVLDRGVSITQVDFDRKGRLFIAGGFYQVVPTETINGKPYAKNNYSGNLIDDIQDGDLLSTVNYLKQDASTMIIAEDEEEDMDEDGLVNDYFGESEVINGKLKFKGGDITFTQNSAETGGFEEEHLISFTRAYNGAAVKVAIGNKADGTPRVYGEKLFNLKYKKVTGAALMGDNHVVVSTAKKTSLVIYSLDGEEVAEPTITLNGNPFVTSAGDMACTQVFDLEGESGTDGQVTDRVIHGENDNALYHEYWNLAEMKLYRPNYPAGIAVEAEPEPNVNRDQRMNSANADIADLRKNPKLFTSLGGDEGYAVMKFRAPTVVTNSTFIQVVETTWGRNADYEYYKKDDNGVFYEDQSAIDRAWNSYKEKATVSVWVPANNGDQPRYVNDTWIDGGTSGEWVEIGTARLTNNIFPLGHIAQSNDKLNYGDIVQWIRIEDNASEEGDHFDINFVSAYSDFCEDYGIGNFDNIGDKDLFVETYLNRYSYADRLDQGNHEGQVSFTNNPKNVHRGFMDEDFGNNVMVVNAAQLDGNRSSKDDPGARASRTFFKDYIPVLAGQEYYFTADVINVIRGKDLNNPVLDMYITYNIGFGNEGQVRLDLPLDLTESDDWQQMGLTWTAPANGIISIGIEEISDLWNGNDFAIDNIAFSCSPPVYTRATPCTEVFSLDFEDQDMDYSVYSDYNYQEATGSNALHPEGIFKVTDDASLYHSLFTNHENESNAMIINGARTSDVKAFKALVNVEEGNYTLSFRVADINVSGSDADIPLTISVDVIESDHVVANVTGEVDNAWQTVTLCWTSQGAGQDEITIVCESTNAGGNDFGLDDIVISKDCSDCQ